MQIFHLGLHKTGTTSLQKNLFNKERHAYHGLHGAIWKLKDARYKWLDFFMGHAAAPLPRDENFVYSFEATLLRCGGLSGIDIIAKQISKNFSNPRVLITVREPSALLASAYFQSLLVRQSSLGYKSLKPIYKQSVRFMAFEEWWTRLISDPSISLAGLVDYAKVKTAFEQWLDPQQIVFLKLEALAGSDPSCVGKLRQLGFDKMAIEHFLAAPPENIGSSRKLQRERPLLAKFCRHLSEIGLAYPADITLRKLGLLKSAEKILYSGTANARQRINTQLLGDIKRKYHAGYDALS